MRKSWHLIQLKSEKKHTGYKSIYIVQFDVEFLRNEKKGKRNRF